MRDWMTSLLASLALMTIGCAPDETAQSAPMLDRVAAPLDVEQLGEVERIDGTGSFTALDLLNSSEDVSVDGVALNLQLSNHRAVAADTEARISVSSAFEHFVTFVPGPRVRANEAIRIDIPAEQLAIGSRELSFSGVIRVDVDVRYADGVREQSNAVARNFHLQAGRWHAYDDATRDAVYAGGALTDAAREASEYLRSLDPTGKLVLVGAAPPGRRLSEDPEFVPENDAEGDSHD